MRLTILTAACAALVLAQHPGTEKSTEMIARFNQVISECRAAQDSLDQGRRMVNRASSADKSTDLAEAGRKLTAAQRHLQACNDMLSGMRRQHEHMSGTEASPTDMTHANTAPGAYSGTNPNTNNPLKQHKDESNPNSPSKKQ